MELIEKTKSAEYIYKGKILNLRKDEVVLPDGKEAKREVVEHSGGAGIVCVKDEKILLVKQFRYPYKEIIYEIPAGKLNKGESPEQTAKRELLEEGGIVSEKMTEIFRIYPSPGYTDEIIYIYYAEGLTQKENRLDEDEFLDSEWIGRKTAERMVLSGEIKDAKTVIAVMWLKTKENL